MEKDIAILPLSRYDELIELEKSILEGKYLVINYNYGSGVSTVKRVYNTENKLIEDLTQDLKVAQRRCQRLESDVSMAKERIPERIQEERKFLGNASWLQFKAWQRKYLREQA